MAMIHAKPRVDADGTTLVVRDPDRKGTDGRQAVVPAEGMPIDDQHPYWIRRLQQGDMVRAAAQSAPGQVAPGQSGKPAGKAPAKGPAAE